MAGGMYPILFSFAVIKCACIRVANMVRPFSSLLQYFLWVTLTNSFRCNSTFLFYVKMIFWPYSIKLFHLFINEKHSNPILNSQARHGTRSPTKKRMRELDNLATHLESLLKDVKEQNLSLEKVPSWLWGWTSPWKGKLKGGELTDAGENELYHLGIRTEERFPDLFNEAYHPDVFTIKATQVSHDLVFLFFQSYRRIKMLLLFGPMLKTTLEVTEKVYLSFFCHFGNFHGECYYLELVNISTFILPLLSRLPQAKNAVWITIAAI